VSKGVARASRRGLAFSRATHNDNINNDAWWSLAFPSSNTNTDANHPRKSYKKWDSTSTPSPVFWAVHFVLRSFLIISLASGVILRDDFFKEVALALCGVSSFAGEHDHHDIKYETY